MKRRLLNENGVVILATKGINDKRYSPKKLSEKEQSEIDFCLDCKKTKCNGNCKTIKQFRKGGYIK